MQVNVIHKDEWLRDFSEFTHFVTFGEFRPRELESINYALLVGNEKKACGYVTCIEFDKETVYFQSGGALDGSSAFETVKTFQSMVSWAIEKYKRIAMRIDNENLRMIHLALKCGFRIIGTWNINNKIYLETILDGSKCHK